MGKASRDKGLRGEREFAKLVGGVRVPLSGAAGGDLFGNDVQLPNGKRAEVKRFKVGEKTLYGWIMDEREKPDVVAFRADAMPWVVAMKVGEFVRMLDVEMYARRLMEHMDGGLPDPSAFNEFMEVAECLAIVLGKGSENKPLEAFEDENNNGENV